MFHTNLAIGPHNFEPIPFGVHPNSLADGASLGDDRVRLPTNDCCTDQFVAGQGFAADALVAPDADFELVDVASALAVALTSAGFVDLEGFFYWEISKIRYFRILTLSQFLMACFF